MSDQEKMRWRGAIAMALVGGAIALMIMGLPGWGWCLFAAVITTPGN